MNLNALSNMNARSACPKCDGYGYIHDTLDKHDKPDRRTRCKKCNDCQVCSGSGVVVGKAACRTCKARGFIHAGSTRHTINEFVMCEQCLVCKDCIAGIPRHIAKKLPKAAPAFLENPQDLPSHASAPHLDAQGLLPRGPPTSLTSTPSPFFESLFASDSAHFLGSAAQRRQMVAGTGKHVSAAQTLVQFNAEEAFSEAVKATIDCMRCLGKGWKHESAAKHDRAAGTRCKTCINCRACSGKGKVDADKIPCTDCNLAGFFHPSPENDLLRPHDAPPTLRCFYCQVCSKCAGLGVTSAPTVAKKEQGASPPRQILPPATLLNPLPPPIPAPPAQPLPPRNIPAPPVLAVVMMRSAENPDVQVPMVDLPGIGLVPAEQILKMHVPMVVMPSITAPAVAPGMPMMVQSSGPGMGGDFGGAVGAAPVEKEVVVDDFEGKEAVLKNVWGS